MENVKIITVAMSVFSISLLLSFSLLVQPQNQASAVTILTKTWFNSAKVEDSFYYTKVLNKVVIGTTNSTAPACGGGNQSCVQIRVFSGSNPLSSLNNATISMQNTWGQHANNILCSDANTNQYCYWIRAQSVAPTGIALDRFSLTNYGFSEYKNTTFTGGSIQPFAQVGSLLYLGSSGGGGTNLPNGIWAFNIVTAFDGVANDGLTLQRLHAISPTHGGWASNGCFDSSSNLISTVDGGRFVGKLDVSTGQWTDLGTDLGAVVDHVFCYGGSAYYSSSAGGWVKKVNPSSGAVVTTITLASSFHTTVHGSQLLVSDQSTSVKAYDLTSLTLVGTYSGFTGISSSQHIVNGNATTFYLLGGNEKFYLYNGVQDDGSGGASPPPSGNTAFCSDPANVDILICRNGGNGESGSARAFIIGNVSQGTGIVGIGCSLGWVDCISNPDVKTNGLGLLIFIASIFVVVGMFYYFAGKDAFQMPLFIWILIIIALSAFFTITQIIDPVFLIISIVAIVALAAPKVLTVLRGGNTFGGGSSE